MGGGYTCTPAYDAPDAQTGDAFVQITENITFKAEDTVVIATAASLAATLPIPIISVGDMIIYLGSTLALVPDLPSRIAAGGARFTITAPLGITAVMVSPAIGIGARALPPPIVVIVTMPRLSSGIITHSRISLHIGL